MNEGGRGELTYLPNGAQVIPHDISVKYAKEAARANTYADTVDLTGVLEGLVIQIINNTMVDGTPVERNMRGLYDPKDRKSAAGGFQSKRVCIMERYEIYFNGSSGKEHGVFLPDIQKYPNQKKDMKHILFRAGMEN